MGTMRGCRFNDTVVFSYVTECGEPNLEEVSKFISVLRSFLVNSLERGFFFRGAVAHGEFTRDSDGRFVVGTAINAASQWHADAAYCCLAPRLTGLAEAWSDY